MTKLYIWQTGQVRRVTIVLDLVRQCLLLQYNYAFDHLLERAAKTCGPPGSCVPPGTV